MTNLGPAFEEFWRLAKDKQTSEQFALWDKVIEAPQKKFYDAYVWQGLSSPEGMERRRELLASAFLEYSRDYPAIIRQFRMFSLTLDEQTTRFQKVFPDAKFDIDVYAVPSPTFNGRGTEGPNTGFDRAVLAFGIDTAVIRGDDVNVLFSHELFHIYHADAMKLQSKQGVQQKFSLPLWMEGLATYVSEVMNPSAPRSSILMDSELAKLNPAEVRWLASEYLKVVDERDFDPAKPGLYKKWFNISNKFKLREGLPGRCAYLLGLTVVDHLVQKRSLMELAHWSPERAHIEVRKVLRLLAQNSRVSLREPVILMPSSSHYTVTQNLVPAVKGKSSSDGPEGLR